MPGTVAIDLRVRRRIVHRLRKLKISEKAQPAQLGMNLLRKRIIVFEFRALHGNVNRRGRAETHHLADDVPRFERNLQLRKRLFQCRADMLARRFIALRPDFQPDAHDGVLWTRCKQINQVDRVAGGLSPDVIAGDADIVRPNRSFNYVKRL